MPGVSLSVDEHAFGSNDGFHNDAERICEESKDHQHARALRDHSCCSCVFISPFWCLWLPSASLRNGAAHLRMQMLDKYRMRAVERVSWLDSIVLPRVNELVGALSDPTELQKHRAFQTNTELRLRSLPALIVEMPCFEHPVIHDERPYPGVPGGGSGGAQGGPPPGAGVEGLSSRPPGFPVMDAGRMAGAGGRAWDSPDLLAGAGVEAFMLVSDYEMEEDNPVEHKYRKLAHDQLRGLVDPELKPNRDERQRIDALVASRHDHLRMEDRDLLWKFRYCLTDNKRCCRWRFTSL